MTRSNVAEAFLLGDPSMARPLAKVGVPVTIISGRDAPARFSRLGVGWLEDLRPDASHMVDAIIGRAQTLPSPPVLFYQTTEDVLFTSRHRTELETAVRFVLPRSDLVEQLVDKGQFQRLAEQKDLPVPRGQVIRPGERPPDDLSFPVVVKPVQREKSWRQHTPRAKAVQSRSAAELAKLLESFRSGEIAVVVQEQVPGPESRIETYHVYVDDEGAIVAEFTGRKLRTYPHSYGHSTALTTTDAPDLVALGRAVVASLDLRGVAKLDFKRDKHGRLWLLEINPRFNLWHYLGAAAGVNLPALVHADLTGIARPAVAPARPGVTWAWVPRDLFAAKAEGWSTARWLRWLRRVDAVDGVVPTDPLPILAGRAWPAAMRKLRRST